MQFILIHVITTILPHTFVSKVASLEHDIGLFIVRKYYEL